jgi:hypothetical protein
MSRCTIRESIYGGFDSHPEQSEGSGLNARRSFAALRMTVLEAPVVHLPLTLLLIAFVTLPGCGNKYADRGNVAGEVKLDGNPIEQGSILFAPIDGTQGVAVGGSIQNGHFRLSGEKGPSLGWNRVEIRAPRKTGKKVPRGLGATGEMVEEEVEAVAPRFNSQSTLKVEVKPGGNTANLDVRTK